MALNYYIVDLELHICSLQKTTNLQNSVSLGSRLLVFAVYTCSKHGTENEFLNLWYSDRCI